MIALRAIVCFANADERCSSLHLARPKNISLYDYLREGYQMSQILFVSPNFTPNLASVPIGLVLLATILERDGHKPAIVQFCQFGGEDDYDSFLENAVEKILAEEPRIVSFYTRCDVYHLELKISEQIKQRRPEVTVVFGGPQSDLCAEETMRSFSCVDYICRGEGETVILPLFNSILANAPDESLPGLTFVRDGVYRSNPRPALLEDLDSLPNLDYSLLMTGDADEKPTGGYPVDVGRGCPFSCTFCSTKTFWQRHYRLKSADRIVDEIRNIHERLGYTTFSFVHDMFTMNRAKVVNICNQLQALDFPIRWHCSARVDCLDPELLDIMTASGMEWVYVGIETGSPRMQRLTQKNLKLQTVEPLMEYARRKNLYVTASFIFGFPEETEEDVNQTLDLCFRLIECRTIRVQLHLCAFFPGTELYYVNRDRLKPADVFSNASGDIYVKECAEMIFSHPDIFPQYFTLDLPLRKELEYLDFFFTVCSGTRPVYTSLYRRRFRGNGVEMYRAWRRVNEDRIDKILTHVSNHQYALELYSDDRFLAQFADDPLYSRMKGVLDFENDRRFLSTMQPGTKIYPFSYRDFKAGLPLEDFREGFTVAHFLPDGNGRVSMQIGGN